MIKTKWDLTGIYPTWEEFDSDFEKIKSLLPEFLELKGQFTNGNKKSLLKYFELFEKHDPILEKLAVFARCRKDQNARDSESARKYFAVCDYISIFSEQTAFIKCEISSLDEGFLTSLLSDSDFKNATRFIYSIIREKQHVPTEREEQLMANVSSFSDYHDTFSTLVDIEMHFDDVTDENGEVIKLNNGNYNLYLKSPSQDFRKKVMDTYLEEFQRFKLTISNLYISNVKFKNLVAKLNKFDSMLDMDAHSDEITREIMLNNKAFIEKNAGLLQRFFKIKKKCLGVEKFYASDINAEITLALEEKLNRKQNDKSNDNISKKPEQIPFEDCVDDILNSYAPLGKDYQEMFKKALAEGWFDVYPDPDKANGGYTISTYLIHPYILLNHDGTDHWKSAITHEFGHAMHSYYSSAAQPYLKSGYTIFIAEVASLTNEVLLSKYMLEKETDKIKKAKIISNFLSLFYLNVFNTSILSEFEYFAHTKIGEGVSLSADDLSNEYLNICKRYFGDSVEINENFKYDWERKSHIFRDYYVYKYATGLISACAIASKILSDKTGEYTKKYRKFLKIGDSASPLDSLAVAEIDITKEETYNYAFSIFEEYVKKLEELYEEI